VNRIADVVRWLGEFAPFRLAESWDNVGLLWGDPQAPVTRVMTCLTITSETSREAIDGRAELILSHHPILFRGAKQVRTDTVEGGILWALARAGVSVASPHTAFDNTNGGINHGLASRFGLVEVGPLRAGGGVGEPEFKIVVFAPRSDREAVLNAAFAAGAGRIGLYEECSYSGMGFGTFFGTEGADPTVGRPGRRERVREWRVEVICPAQRRADVLEAIRSAHSYEEPAIDVYPLAPSREAPGAGRLGRLVTPRTLDEFARLVAETLKAPGLLCVGPPERLVEWVAIACGAGDDFVPDAARAGADVLLTGESRYHRALEAQALGLGLIVAGHHATERPGVEDLADRVQAAFPDLEVWASRTETDPLRRLADA
jgi:dinuclear metal center YbgI/SA1388 family protein